MTANTDGVLRPETVGPNWEGGPDGEVNDKSKFVFGKGLTNCLHEEGNDLILRNTFFP